MEQILAAPQILEQSVEVFKVTLPTRPQSARDEPT